MNVLETELRKLIKERIVDNTKIKPAEELIDIDDAIDETLKDIALQLVRNYFKEE